MLANLNEQRIDSINSEKVASEFMQRPAKCKNYFGIFLAFLEYFAVTSLSAIFFIDS